MQQIQNEITQIFADHLALIGADIQAWSDLLAEDAIVEFPYAAALGVPAQFKGKSAISTEKKDDPLRLNCVGTKLSAIYSRRNYHGNR